MRLYLLELTPLEYLSDLSTPPTNGDIVAYMRAGQDPSGVHNSLTPPILGLILSDCRRIDKS